MRNISAQFQTALNNSRDTGIVPRRFVWITGKDRTTGDPVTQGFWNGDDDIQITMVSATTGLTENRSYLGLVNLEFGGIKRTSDLTVQSIEVKFSQLAAATQLIVRGYDLRLAKVEIHEILMDPISRLPVSTPFPVFLGEVDAAPITTPAIGDDGDITLSVVSDAISMLTRTNPKKSSYQSQKRRNGDLWGKFGSTVATWGVRWGQK